MALPLDVTYYFGLDKKTGWHYFYFSQFNRLGLGFPLGPSNRWSSPGPCICLFSTHLSIIHIHIYTVGNQQAIVEQRHLNPPTWEFEVYKAWYSREATEDGTKREDIRGLGGQPVQIKESAASHSGCLTKVNSINFGQGALILENRSSPLLNRTSLPYSFLLSLLSWDPDLVAEKKSACSQQEKPWWMDSFASRKNGRGICVTGDSRGTCSAIRDLLMLPPLHQTMASSLIATERNSYSQKIMSSEKLSQPSWRWPQWSTTRVLRKRGEVGDRKSLMEASWARKKVDAQLTVDAGDDDRKLQLEANTYHQRPSAHQIQEWLILAFQQRIAIVQNDVHSRQRRLVLGCRAGRPTTDWKMHARELLKPEPVWENHRCFCNPAKESRSYKGMATAFGTRNRQKRSGKGPEKMRQRCHFYI